MKKSKVLEFFGGTTRTAVAFGLTKSAVSKWEEEIPLLRALQAEKITAGQLSDDFASGCPIAGCPANKSGEPSRATDST